MSAASWGGSDFVGGLASRRASPLLITLSGQSFSLLLLAGVCFAFHAALPDSRTLALIAASGFEAALALALFYRALSMGGMGGGMGLTAALTGLMTALAPVVFSAFHYGLPAPVTIAGLAAGCIAIWLITHQHARSGEASSALALLLGTLAGCGFGIQLILFKIAEPATIAAVAGNAGIAGILIMAVARAAGVTALLLIVFIWRPRGTGQDFWVPGLVTGVIDTAGSLFYLGAARYGRLDAAAVICSLYPAATILLSTMVLRERPSRRQLAGMALAIGAVALLSL